ncbi:sigma-70 family RNA polymerase sigma factor [Kitasatospora putterlickiae]|uniref:Sigma-70 family RNA polymerase sigma factor n=1 Tax=Kitasatospora putterlickiae TaxID=221725 RepID=A0ABP4IV66_9ACTN
MRTPTLNELVDDCIAGNPDSWSRIVERYTPLIWAIARGHRLSTADCEDVSQTTWMRVIQHLGKLRDPEKLSQWIAVSARRESLKHIEKSGRTSPVGDSPVLDRSEPSGNHPEEVALAKERDNEVLVAYCALSPKCQALLGLLVTDPPMSYDEISATLGMPRGSLGPIRARCLTHLAKLLQHETERSGRAKELADAVTRSGMRTYALELQR